MVKPIVSTLALALVACAPVNAVVLSVDRESDASPAPGNGDAGIISDAGSQPDAAPDAAPDTLGKCRIAGASEGFYESFPQGPLDATRWLVAEGQKSFGGESMLGGFSRENVSVEGGDLVLRVRGDRYAGPVRGWDARGEPLPDGRRTGAAIATRDLFASGTYQAQGHFVAPAGVRFALWFVRDDDSEGAIDIATPGRDGDAWSYTRVDMRSRSGLQSSANSFLLPTSFDDGDAHILRFDWYTTAASAASFWVDDQPRWQTDQALPTQRAGRLWLVAWLPGEAPADFDTAEIRLDSAFVTPFGNSGDACRDGELRGPALTVP
jgi:hypothetical protein